MFSVTAKCSKAFPRGRARKSPVLLCRSSSVRVLSRRRLPRATLHVIPQAGPNKLGLSCRRPRLYCFVHLLSASMPSPAPAESGKMSFFFFLFAALDSLCQLCCDASPPPSHMTKAAPVLCVSWKTAASCAVCVCVHVLFFLCRLLGFESCMLFSRYIQPALLCLISF